MTALRHLAAILSLPFVVVVVVPLWLLASQGRIDSRWGDAEPAAWLPRAAGGLLFLGGLALFSWCVWLFARAGRGTLAPWDPTTRLVAAGPYRHTRNPMISGVAVMLAGQALLWGSWVMGAWAAVFIGANHLYFLLSEEPGLERRFGEPYRMYKKNVPRWVPRVDPWEGP